MYRKEKQTQITKGKVNSTLFYIFLGLLIFGTVMIFDASVYKASEQFSDPFYFLKQHIIWIFAGLVAGSFFYFIDYKLLYKLSPLFLLATISSLIAVLIFGDTINGSTRWLEIFGMRIQPAEFAKLFSIIYFASILSKKEVGEKGEKLDEKTEFFRKLSKFGVVLIVLVYLIMKEPDMGTTMMIAITSLIIFFLSGENRIHTLGSMLIAGGFGLIGVVAGIVAPYRFDRIRTFLHLLFKGEVDNPTGEGYQMQQILIGIGSSGFFGKGFGQSRQRFGYLVENTAFTDSIFAVVLEELGFAIAIILVGVWMGVLYIGIKISMSIEDKFGSLLVAGIVVWLVIQSLINMGANVGLVPLTGIPLPFFTYGGSNTIVTICAVALLLNVSRYAKIETK